MQMHPEQQAGIPRGRFKKGLIQIYTGDGKGKTTAALGLGLRAFGHGYRVRVIQFMKGTSYTGELAAIRSLGPGYEIFQFGRDCKFAESMAKGEFDCNGCGECFVVPGKAEPCDITMAEEAYDLSRRTLELAEADLVVLDEIANAVRFGLITAGRCEELAKCKPEGVELVLTGRNMPQSLIDMADLVTEMRMLKHPFEKGIVARHGIEY